MSKSVIVMLTLLGWAAIAGAAAQAPLTRDTFKNAAATALPSVVNIHVRAAQEFSATDPNRGQGGDGTGSGVIINADGYIVTNKHVVSGNVRLIEITTADGETFPATLVGVAPDTDLAVLHTTAPRDKLKPAVFRDSDTIESGEIVVAIGSPLGLRNSVTHGIVSAVRVMEDEGRPNMPPHPLIQTDAAINPGNSGGPLVDLDGKVVGINTLIVTTTGSSMGLGFAIPSNVAKTVYEQIASHQTTLGWIGVTTQNLDADLARIFVLPSSAQGLVVTAVAPGSPGATAGLRQGDCIEKADGKLQTDAVSFEWLVRNRPVGASLALSVRTRNGLPRMVTLKIAERPAP